jgi:hypothetical protein
VSDTFSHIGRCLDLTDRDFERAVSDKELCMALLDQIAKVATPSTGAPKLLLLFVRIMQQGCDWIDGTLRVELVGGDEITQLEVISEIGALRERIMPTITLRVPLVEFTRAVQRVPHMIEPLELVTSSKRRMVLVAVLDDRIDGSGPQIGESSLFRGSSIPQVPAVPSFPEEAPSGKLTFSLKAPTGSVPPPSPSRRPPPLTRPPPGGPPSSIPPMVPLEADWDQLLSEDDKK